MVEIVVLKPGSIERTSSGAILDARSSVTLILGEERIIVDTGNTGDERHILSGLGKNGLGPRDIDVVINTHAHRDHVTNNDLFEDAIFMLHPSERASWRFEPLSDDQRIMTGVTVVETPGHTRGSITVLADTAEGVVGMVGDAIPTRDNYIKWVPPGINYDPERALRSMERIRERADIVVPGHDAVFKK